MAPGWSWIACPRCANNSPPAGKLAPRFRLKMLLSIPADFETLPARLCKPPAKLPPVNLLSVPEISAVILLVAPVNPCKLLIAPPTVVEATLPIPGLIQSKKILSKYLQF